MDSKDRSAGGCGECGNDRPAVMVADTSRRSLLSWLLGGGVTASLASFFYPVLRFLNPPRGRKQSSARESRYVEGWRRDPG